MKSLLCLLAVVGCNVGLYNGPDRPDDNAASFGPPPPTDFHCERGNPQHTDRNNDKKPDYVVHVVNGETVCHGEDQDYDGDIDHWTMYRNGKPVQHAHNKGGVGPYVVTPHQDADAGLLP